MRRKLAKVTIAIVALFLLVIFLPSFIGTLTLGISWGLTSREAEKEIKQYIESFDAKSLLGESLPLIEKAKRHDDTDKTHFISTESLPEEWKERKVMFIYYTNEYVDYVWTGGVLGRRAIMVRKESSGLVIEASIRPDDPPLILYPPKTEGTTSRDSPRNHE